MKQIIQFQRFIISLHIVASTAIVTDTTTAWELKKLFYTSNH